MLEQCRDGSQKQDIVKKEFSSETNEYFIHFHKKKYIYSKEKKQFERIKAKADWPLTHFHNELNSSSYKTAFKFDSNLMDFPLPDFMKIFKEQVMDPLNFFQLFSVALWFFDDNFFHPIMTIVMVMISIFSVAVDRMTTMMNLRSLILKPQYIYAYRDKKWNKISSAELRPGDLVSVLPSNKVKEIVTESSEEDNIDLIRQSIPFGNKIPKGMIMKMYSGGKNESKPVLPCDMVVLSGSCVVDESILTGESIPLIKDSILHCNDKNEKLNIKSTHKSNALFCGTEVLQTFHPADLPASIHEQAPDGGCIAYVLRTGFDTAKGKLSRSVIFNNENISLKQTEAFILLGLLLILSIAASLYVLNEGMKDENRDRQKLFLRCILIITSVVPPELPMIMNISINTSLMYLRRKRIFCTEPIRIPLAGRIDVCAFDKTGTLTTDKLEVKGVVVDTQSGKVIPDLNEAIIQKPQVAMVMGGCNTVVMHEGQLLGDPIEKLFFDSSNWKFNHNLKMSFNSKKTNQQVQIKFTHPFRSDLKRMCAVCKVEGFEGIEGHFALVKGAPEVVGKLLSSKPANYDSSAFTLMKEGYRVLALAYKKLPSYHNQLIERDELECNLEFAGLLVLSCPMKKDTPHYIQILKEANYRNIMITGDNMFTAAKTGQDLGFGASSHNLFLRKLDGKLKWFDVHDKELKQLDKESLKSLSKDYTLCVEGSEMNDLFALDKDLFREVIHHTVIFARVSPEQKEQIVKELKEKGLKVLMCGDGTNDVGGLKKSDVGIALVGIKDEPSEAEVQAEKDAKKKAYEEAVKSRNFQRIKELSQQTMGTNEVTEFKSGDACIAAPFTNKFSNSLKCVITVVRQGVCTMCTTIQTYRILTLQSLIYAYTMSTLHLENLKTSDAQNTCMGVFGAYFFFQLSNSKVNDNSQSQSRSFLKSDQKPQFSTFLSGSRSLAKQQYCSST